MLRLLLENGARANSDASASIQNLCDIKNYEITEHLVEEFNKDMIKLEASKKQIGIKKRLKLNKTLLCLTERISWNDPFSRCDDAAFEEFQYSINVCEALLGYTNSEKKDLEDSIVLTSMILCLRYEHVLWHKKHYYTKFLNVINYIIECCLQETFEDTECNEFNYKSHTAKKLESNDKYYELAKSELVDRNFEMLKLLVEYGMDVNANGSLILQTAYKAGDMNWIDYFISKGIRFEGKSDGFEQACRSNNIEVLEHWVRNGGVIPKNPEYECINMACLLDNFDMVKLLVESGVDLSDPERNGVRIACKLGLRRTLKYLLDNNAEIKGVRHHQLEYACIIEDIGVVKMILEHYDSLGILKRKDNSSSKDEENPQIESFLDNKKADGFEEYKITKALLERSEPIQNSDLIDGIKAAVTIANIEILRLLLTYKFNLSDASKILKIAVQAGNTEVIKLLFENGWNASSGTNALDVALDKKNIEVIRLLLEHGAQVKRDSYSLKEIIVENIEILELILSYCPYIGGSSCLLKTAIEKNEIEIVKLLLKDTTSLNDSKYNFIFQACTSNNLEILKILFEKGARIKRGKESGVIQACENNNLKILKLLLEGDSTLVLKKDYGMKEAIDHENVEIINLLIEYGADTSAHRELIIRVANNLNDKSLIEFCQYKEGMFKKAT